MLKEKFNAYNFKDMQALLHLLNECESVGITDIRFVRKQIYDYIRTSDRIDARPGHRRIKKQPETVRNCPSCGKESFRKREVDGVLIWTCMGKDKCGFSEVDNESDLVR